MVQCSQKPAFTHLRAPCRQQKADCWTFCHFPAGLCDSLFWGALIHPWPPGAQALFRLHLFSGWPCSLFMQWLVVSNSNLCCVLVSKHITSQRKPFVSLSMPGYSWMAPWVWHVWAERWCKHQCCRVVWASAERGSKPLAEPLRNRWALHTDAI